MRKVLNAFSVAEVASLTGLKPAMIHYLAQQGYLVETCREDADAGPEDRRRARGNAKFYSFRALVIAKTMERLLSAGVRLSHLKKALENLRSDHHWVCDSGDGPRDLPVSFLVTDGNAVFLKDEAGYVDLVRKGGQRSFAFVVEMGCIRDELVAKIELRFADRRPHCTYVQDAPIYAAS